MTTIYRGYSTVDNYLRSPRLTDFDLVKRDLLNHFNIRKGEKLGNPSFGTIIWDTMFEPFTTDVENAIIDDVKRIVAYDPRLNVTNVIITEYEYGLQIEIELNYAHTNLTSQLSLNFDRALGVASTA
jgi:phage baseplate assembly protein W